MNVGQLRDLLEGLDDDAPVRLAIQPNWPLRLDVSDVKPADEIDFDDEGDEDEPDDNANIVWIVASGSAPYGENPYAPRQLWY